MTNSEALEELNIDMECGEFHNPSMAEAAKIAIQALEKHIPKKPKLVTRADGIIKFYPCPCCSALDKYISVYPRQKYCVECGQKLDWSE